MKPYILILLFLSSCSIIKFSPSKEGIDPKLKPYIYEFIKASGGMVTEDSISNLSANFDDLTGSLKYANGVCWWTLNGSREILIDKQGWYRNTEMENMILMFHELGHCTCDKLHSMRLTFAESWYEKTWNGVNSIIMKLGMIKKYGYLGSGCPSSIMAPGAISSTCLMLHYNYYMEDLFDGC